MNNSEQARIEAPSNHEVRNGHISINLRTQKSAVSYLTRVVRSSLENGQKVFKIRIENTGHLYPNICVPLAGAIKHFEEVEGCRFLPSKSVGKDTFAGRSGLLNPFYDPTLVKPNAFLDKVWEFDEGTQYAIVDGLVESMRFAEIFPEGMLNGLELCINEVMDNVLVHSRIGDKGIAKGYVMAQVHRASNRVAVAVYDNGVGIARSLAASNISFESPRDAIALALKKGVTDGKGAGNGLWMLDSIVKMGHGSLDVSTSGVSYSCWHQTGEGLTERYSQSKMVVSGTTLVDFQLDTRYCIDLESVMGVGGFTDLWAEAREDCLDEASCALLVNRDACGLGSRHDALGFARLVGNSAKMFKGTVTLDFAGVEVISMSFADELILQLVEELGFVGFMGRVRLAHLNPLCASIVDDMPRTIA